ncbi:HIT domain-containing protein [Nonomuraea sp. SMC257]|uniref:HIT domain-containing protein n=1 Tax=Nonomuraea montanisoli TaxID=2741721 RepID=A0A7Y6IAL4_9ACTN|nr:HIT domain-containing protein [Nonomuraea montanisoli]
MRLRVSYDGRRRGPFARWADTTEPSQTIHEDEHAIAFLNLAQATRGHTLVVPGAHHRDLGEIPAETAAHVMRAAVEVSCPGSSPPTSRRPGRRSSTRSSPLRGWPRRSGPGAEGERQDRLRSRAA